jgi:threonine dehydrogenase-like Zn-dependent dehydrogenase
MKMRTSGYRRADEPLPQTYTLWPLYGTGFDNLGRGGAPIAAPMPQVKPDELLVRHDAVGICFSDVKVIRTGREHVRIRRDMREAPAVLGHEVTLTVVGVGAELRDRYAAGDRFVVQADIVANGIGQAYGYALQGGLSQYSILDRRVLDGDDGCYLVRIGPSTGYAEAALMEPWACVEASYSVAYRTGWLDGGTVWMTGDGTGATLGRAHEWRPSRIHLDVTDQPFAAQVSAWASASGIEVTAGPPDEPVDDVVVLSADPGLIEDAFGRAASGAVCAVIAPAASPCPVHLDIGRLHYDNLAVVGAVGSDISAAYTPIRAEIKPGGRMWVLGAGGPLGHMHLQRALAITARPAAVVATTLREERLLAVTRRFAAAAGDTLTCVSQEGCGSEAALAERLRTVTADRGFDDIAVMAPSARAIELAAGHLADEGVINVFAGLPRGTLVTVDLDAIVRRGVRFSGNSGSSVDDLRRVRDLTESGNLSPGEAVVAIAGLEAVPDALRAVADGRFPGKVVIFPNLRRPLPLTPLAELELLLPTVAAKLHGGHWSAAAEDELLHLLL